MLERVRWSERTWQLALQKRKRFFDWLAKPLAQMALDLRTTLKLMLTMAAHEGGWSTRSLDHNQPLNNPFGVNRTHKGIAIGNVHYPNLDAAIRYWKDKYGPRVQGMTDAASFVSALQNPKPGQGEPYNSVNAGYSDEFVAVYESMGR